MTGLGIERIVVVLDPGGEHLAAIHAASELASVLRIPLHGIFAEDEALLDLPRFAVSTHFELGNLTTGALESGLMAAALEVEAQRCRGMIDATASRQGIEATFSVWRGRPSFRSIGAGRSDLVVVEGFSRPVTGQAGLQSSWIRRLTSDDVSVLVLRRGLARHLVIGSLADGDGPARPMEIAGPLARRLGGSVVMLRLAGLTHEISGTAKNVSGRDRLPAHGPEMPGGQEPGALIERVSALKCDMVVLDEKRIGTETSLAFLVGGDCSVLVLRHP